MKSFLTLQLLSTIALAEESRSTETVGLAADLSGLDLVMGSAINELAGTALAPVADIVSVFSRALHSFSGSFQALKPVEVPAHLFYDIVRETIDSFADENGQITCAVAVDDFLNLLADKLAEYAPVDLERLFRLKRDLKVILISFPFVTLAGYIDACLKTLESLDRVIVAIGNEIGGPSAQPTIPPVTIPLKTAPHGFLKNAFFASDEKPRPDSIFDFNRFGWTGGLNTGIWSIPQWIHEKIDIDENLFHHQLLQPVKDLLFHVDPKFASPDECAQGAVGPTYPPSSTDPNWIKEQIKNVMAAHHHGETANLLSTNGIFNPLDLVGTVLKAKAELLGGVIDAKVALVDEILVGGIEVLEPIVGAKMSLLEDLIAPHLGLIGGVLDAKCALIDGILSAKVGFLEDIINVKVNALGSIIAAKSALLDELLGGHVAHICQHLGLALPSSDHEKAYLFDQVIQSKVTIVEPVEVTPKTENVIQGVVDAKLKLLQSLDPFNSLADLSSLDLADLQNLLTAAFHPDTATDAQLQDLYKHMVNARNGMSIPDFPSTMSMWEPVFNPAYSGLNVLGGVSNLLADVNTALWGNDFKWSVSDSASYMLQKLESLKPEGLSSDGFLTRMMVLAKDQASPMNASVRNLMQEAIVDIADHSASVDEIISFIADN